VPTAITIAFEILVLVAHSDEFTFSTALGCALVSTVVLNFALGPGLWAFYHRKKSAVIILTLCICALCVGAVPGLLLWVWAFCGKQLEPAAVNQLPPQLTRL
jgi:hypothetical protein